MRAIGNFYAVAEYGGEGVGYLGAQLPANYEKLLKYDDMPKDTPERQRAREYKMNERCFVMSVSTSAMTRHD